MPKSKTKNNLARNIPVSMDKELLAEIDAVAGDRDETRSLIMRKAIQAGLPIVKTGSNADVLTLDSELSADVDQAVKETKQKRNKILLEAIRTGLQPYCSKVMSEKLSLSEVQDPKEREQLLWSLENSYKLYDDPMVRQQRQLIWERGRAAVLLLDILMHVPEAKRRHELLLRLTEDRRKPGAGGGGPAWGNGLSTAEIEWQVTMAEKYGVNSAKWPKEEVEARNVAREAERQNEVKETIDPATLFGPPMR